MQIAWGIVNYSSKIDHTSSSWLVALHLGSHGFSKLSPVIKRLFLSGVPFAFETLRISDLKFKYHCMETKWNKLGFKIRTTELFFEFKFLKYVLGSIKLLELSGNGASLRNSCSDTTLKTF